MIVQSQNETNNFIEISKTLQVSEENFNNIS